MVKNNLLTISYSCSAFTRFSILKILTKLKSAKYTTLRDASADNRTVFGFNLRKLISYKLVSKNHLGMYSLTAKGKIVISIIEKYSEKFISENNDSVCISESSGEHRYITICKRCGNLKP